jgi:ABC-type multidrug transport system ATPase subunit
MRKVLEVIKLHKSFGSFRAVDDLSFTVYQGDIYGFLGPNGSGKSTSIRMVLGLMKADAGEVRLFGELLNENRSKLLHRIGALIERPDFYNYLTAFENLRLLQSYMGQKLDASDIMAKLDMVGLADRAHSKVRTYSQGMKQRLGIAQALLHDPDLIILDEPVNGLDPQGIKDMRNLILTLNAEQGKTFIVSSHILREMELIANRMVVISKGKALVEGNVKELIRAGKQVVTIVADPSEAALVLLQQAYPDNSFQINKLSEIETVLQPSEIAVVNRLLVEAGISVHQLNVRNSLEDYFLQLT